MPYLKETEWKSVKIAIDGKTLTGVQNISYKKTSDDELLYGAGNKPLNVQTGNIAYEGSIKVLKNELDALQMGARALGYDDFSDVPNVVITVAYMPEGGRVLKTDTLIGCKFNDITYNIEQGAKNMAIELPFKYLDKKSI